MGLLPLREIIQRSNSIGPTDLPRENLRADVDLHGLRNENRVILLHAPKNHDSGAVKVRIPIYSLYESEPYPFNGEGQELDLLAWYSSFHYGERDWGIYILRSGIYKIANALISSGFPADSAIAQAQEVLIRHEQAHFQTDLAITSLELANDKPIFVQARHGMKKLKPGWHETEEGLANALARRTIKIAPKIALDDFLNNSPSGYCDWAKYKPVGDSKSWKKVLDQLVHHGPPLRLHTEVAAEVSNALALKYFKDIPVYEVYDIPGGDVNGSYLMGPISDIVETDAFTADLNKLAKGQPIYKKKWTGVKAKLASGNVVGVHLELINKMKSIYSVRIDGEARAGLTLDESIWMAIAAGHHDELYRRLSK
jgi:hypothetical protein